MEKKLLNRKIIIAIFIVIFIIIILLTNIVLHNPDFLCLIAEGFDEPSVPYYFAIERVYKLSTKEDIGKFFLENILKNTNENLHGHYIRILGTIGQRSSLTLLKSYYEKNQYRKAKKIELYFTIKSLGLIGDNEATPFLEKLLQSYDSTKTHVDASTIAVALYLLTGVDSYTFTNSMGKKQNLYLSQRLIDARKIILSSKSRKRTVQEMIILDEVFRPLKSH